MAEITNRDSKEKKIAKSLMRVWVKYKNLFLAEVFTKESRNLPEGYWVSLSSEEKGVIGPVIGDIFREQAAGLAESIAIGFDWAIVNEQASSWAREWTGNLVSDLDGTARRDLQSVISQFFEQPMTRGELEDLVASGRGTFSPARASLVARTEVTRAGTKGEEQMVRELKREHGIDLVAVWQTRNDELVCPICGPRHNRRRGDGWNVGPPAHPNCRCGLSHESRDRPYQFEDNPLSLPWEQG